MFILNDTQIEACRVEIERKLRGYFEWPSLVIEARKQKSGQIAWACPNIEDCINQSAKQYDLKAAYEAYRQIIRDTIQELTGFHNG